MEAVVDQSEGEQLVSAISLPRLPSNSLRHGLKSHPDPYLQPSDIPQSCRICWGEEDDETGGEFLAPCNCTGTSKYVHSRCLQKWIHLTASQRGIAYACRCDICKSSYRRLPASLGIKERLPHRIYRFTAENWQRALQSPAGPLVRSFAASAWIYSSLNGMYFGVAQLLATPTMFLQARQDPITALRPLLPRFLTALVLEPLLSSRDFWFHCETALFYAFGWALDAATRIFEQRTLPFLAPLPQPLQIAFHAALWVPKGIGLAFQALDLTLMSLYGGAMSGFLQGALETAAAPFKILSVAARFGASMLGLLAAAAAKGAHGTVAAARFVARNSAGNP